ncbi:MAG: lipoate--protein ligase family protein [Pirellulales bacterium]|nr:lipoate--protein ligase family protein [Pirellulales bacterium]
MYHLPLTLETPAANLALDEALLDAAAEGELPGEVLRLWEPAEFFVVLGRSSGLGEVHEAACRADGVPLLRRPSGGATVVAGPGCLMYAVVLDAEQRPELRSVDRAHQFVLGRTAKALAPLADGVALAGTSDLTLPAAGGSGAAPRKFSGNSLRLKRHRLLYHGTILYDFPIPRLGRWLDAPARRPDYRGERGHEAFVTNLPASREALTAALVEAWHATDALADWPQARTAALASGRYASPSW